MKRFKKILSVLLVILTIITTCNVVMPVFAEEGFITDGDISEEVIYEKEETEAVIVSEIVEKRTENTKQFLMSDGSYTVARYNNPVHYQDESGRWVDIDNSVSKTEATNEQAELFGEDDIYKTGNSAENIVFAPKGNSNTLVSYEVEDYPVSLNYQSANNSRIKVVEDKQEHEGDNSFLVLDNISQEVVYENIYNDVDLQYIVGPGSLKENIIIKKASAQNVFTVNYNIGELTATVIDSKTIRLMAGDKAVYTISAPLMYDADGNYSDGVTMTVKKNKNGKMTVDIIADSAWLKAEERVYPVTVDPTIIEITSNILDAVYVSSVTPDSIYDSTNLNLIVSKNDETYGNSHAYLKLTDIQSSLYADNVLSAKLNLPVNSATENIYIDLYEISEGWEKSTVKWSDSLTLSDSVADYYCTGTSTDISFDITKLYCKWINGAVNNGVAMVLASDGTVNFGVGASVPVLTVRCTSTSGIKDDYSYLEFDLGSAGHAYVNTLSGNLMLERDEFDTTGENYPYDYKVTYNGFGTVTSAQPLWLKSFDSLVYLNQYISEDGSGFVIETGNATDDGMYSINENDFGWEKYEVVSTISSTPGMPSLSEQPYAVHLWKNEGKERYKFDWTGLQEIAHVDDDDITTIVYSRSNNTEGLAECITDGDGDKLVINYQEDETGEILTGYTITQYDCEANATSVVGDKLIYSLDSNGNIIQVALNRADNIQATYTYDDAKRMTSVTNDEGYTLTFTYDGNSKRIATVTESSNNTVGQTVGLTREYLKSTVRTSGADGTYGNADDVLTVYSFDTSCKVVCNYSTTVSGEELSAVNYEYNDGNANLEGFGGISKISAVGKIPDNLVKNHNVESANNWTSFLLDDKNCTRTASYTTEEAYVGAGSLKINVTDVTQTGGAAFYQIFQQTDGIVESGKTYTLSAYVKTDGITQDADAGTSRNYGASVMMRFIHNDGTNTRTYSQSIQKTNSAINNGWERVHVTFTVPDDIKRATVFLVLRNGTGTAYFDGVQLEEGDTLSQYNMLENNGFTHVDSNNYAESWSRYNLTETDLVEGGRMKIEGNRTVHKGVYQDIMVNANDYDEQFVVSGWAQGDSVPKKSGRLFYIYATVYYKEKDSNGNTITYPQLLTYFNYNDEGKQYTSGAFGLEHPNYPDCTPNKIHIVVCYYKEANTAFFDNIGLFKSSEVYDLAEVQQEETEDETNTEDSYTYNEDGTVATYTDENGTVYTYTYDSLGNVLSILNAQGNGDRFTYYYYDTDNDGVNDSSDIATETYEDGSCYSYTYDENGNINSETSTVDGTTKTCYYTYDCMKNILTERNSENEVDTYDYYYYDTNADGINDRSEIKKEILSDGTVNEYEYHSDYSLKKLITTKNGKTVTYNYDTKGNQTSVERNGFSYNYGYDELGNTTSVSVGNQALVSYGYSNDKSKLKTLTYGNGSGKETYTYNAFGSLTKKAVAGFGNFTWRYDSLNRPTFEKDTANKQKTYYLYDGEGRLYGEMVNSTVNSNAYANELYAYRNTFDSDGNIINQALSANGYIHNLPFTYDEEGRPLTSAMTDIRVMSYSYNDDSQLLTRSLSTNTPIAETFTYTDDGLVSTHRVDDATRDDTYSYTYDDDGNITEIKQNNAVIQSYVYDSDSQLVRENNSVSGKTTTFTYDGYGNITEKKEYAYTTGELGTAADTISYAYDGTWKDKLTSYDGQSISYDAIGNPTSYMGATMTWNGRKLMSYVKEGLNITYSYDSDGLRTRKTVNGVDHNYYYVDGQLMYESDDTYGYYYRYDQDGRLGLILRIRFSDNYKWYYYPVSNSRGDIMEIHDGNGAILAKYSYDAWGRLLSITDANGNTLAEGSFAHLLSVRYRGYYYDSETGLYFLQSRYYDPETGRFLNADDVVFIGYSGENLSYNAFAYCENNAVNCIDIGGFLKQYWWNKVSTVARTINCIVIAFSGIKAFTSQKALKTFLKKNKNKILHAIRGPLVALFGYSKYWWFGPAIEFALELFGTSIGDLIAKAFDKHIDKTLGFKPNNGYIFN